MNTGVSTPSTTTINTTMTIAAIAPAGSPEPTGDEVVSGGGRNKLVDVERCTGASVCEVGVVCEVPVRVIMMGKGSTVEEVARTFSGREPGDDGDGVDEGDGVFEGVRVGEGGGVCDGDGVGDGGEVGEGGGGGEGGGVGEGDGVGDGDGVDGTITAVMTGTAVVANISS